MGLNETGLEALSSITASEFFDVTITNTNSPIQQGDTLTVDYSVTNTGDTTGTQDVTLEIDTVVEDTDAGVRVLANRTESGALEWDTAADETTQDYTATVVSADDSASQTVTVEAGSAIPDSGVSRLTFDNADTDSGTAIDVWNGYDGTINGATTGASGQLGEAYDFDGTDDYVACPSVTELQGVSECTISCWYNYDAEGSGTNSGIIGQTDGFVGTVIWHSNADDSIYFRVENNDGDALATTAVPSSGTWTMLTLTFNSGTVTGYFDDTEETTATDNNVSETLADTKPFEIGRIDGIGNIDGRIDDVRIYSKELSATEVSNLYNTGSISG